MYLDQSLFQCLVSLLHKRGKVHGIQDFNLEINLLRFKKHSTCHHSCTSQRESLASDSRTTRRNLSQFWHTISSKACSMVDFPVCSEAAAAESVRTGKDLAHDPSPTVALRSIGEVACNVESRNIPNEECYLQLTKQSVQYMGQKSNYIQTASHASLQPRMCIKFLRSSYFLNERLHTAES